MYNLSPFSDGSVKTNAKQNHQNFTVSVHYSTVFRIILNRIFYFYHNIVNICYHCSFKDHLSYSNITNTNIHLCVCNIHYTLKENSSIGIKTSNDIKFGLFRFYSYSFVEILWCTWYVCQINSFECMYTYIL